MTSEKKQSSNRANAGKSSGPRSTAGRRHAAQNARKHGLSLPVLSDPLWSEEVEAAVQELVEDTADLAIRQLALNVAIPQIDMCRIRSARQRLFFAVLNNSKNESAAGWRAEDRVHALFILARYERRALSRRKFALRALDQAITRKRKNS